MRTTIRRFISLCTVFFLIIAAVTGCGTYDPYFFTGNYKQDNELKKLFSLLYKEKDEIRYVIVKQISQILMKNNDRNKQIIFLTNYVERNPFDPYNSYYLLLVAESYEDSGALPFAMHYYKRILKNHPDLVVNGSNIHFRCITKLLTYGEDAESRLEYYKELLSRFEDQVDDKGKIYFSLAKTYEEVGEWSQAIQTYEKFLKQPHTRIPGLEDVYKDIEKKIDFYNSDYRNWTVEDLDFLVDEIKNAIATKNARKLERYKAKVNFFAMNWEQKNYDETRARYFNLATFLYSSDVRVDTQLDIDSNSNEAYLRTTHWSYMVTTWFFYFRRVDFPTDPEIDGRWEWAGIYFGEKM
ncbi:MAG: hypothetical protein JW881_01965 [Spirochaetales bacterium]|nr:hypothetical protein [Spirochaetales bacterium]